METTILSWMCGTTDVDTAVDEQFQRLVVGSLCNNATKGDGYATALARKNDLVCAMSAPTALWHAHYMLP